MDFQFALCKNGLTYAQAQVQKPSIFVFCQAEGYLLVQLFGHHLEKKHLEISQYIRKVKQTMESSLKPMENGKDICETYAHCL